MAARSKRSKELEDDILARLSSGEPLSVICRDKDITPQAWADWCKADESLGVAHGRARDLGFQALAEQCLEIADNERHDWVMTQKGEVTDVVAIGRAKLQVETRLKLLACWDPRRYGPKLDLNANVQTKVRVTIGGDA